jgi:CRP/FNR family transcriptional regulator
MLPSLTSLVEAYPAFRGLPQPLAADLASTARAIRAPAGHLLFEAGMDCEGVPFVLRGTVRVVRTLPSGQDVPLYRLTPGTMCALSVHAALARTPHVARAEFVDDAQVVIVPAVLMHALLAGHAPLRLFLLTDVAARGASLVTVIDQVAARLDERLAHLLSERGPVLTVTHQELADELGTAREVVSRILEGFENHGAVRLRRGRVEVLDRSRLTRLPRKAVPLRESRLAG